MTRFVLLAVLMPVLAVGARSAVACTFAPGTSPADDVSVDTGADDPSLSLQLGAVDVFRNPGEGSVGPDCSGLGRVEVNLTLSSGASLDPDQAYLVDVDGLANDELMENVTGGPVYFNSTEPFRFYFLDVGQGLDFEVTITPISSSGALGEPLSFLVVDGDVDDGGCRAACGPAGASALALVLLALGALERRRRLRSWRGRGPVR